MLTGSRDWAEGIREGVQFDCESARDCIQSASEGVIKLIIYRFSFKMGRAGSSRTNSLLPEISLFGFPMSGNNRVLQTPDVQWPAPL